MNWPSGKRHGQVAQVVLAGAVHDQLAARRRAAGGSPASGCCRRPDRYAPVDRLLVRQQALDRSAVHDLAAVLAGARTDVDDPVGGPDGVLVVLDHDQRVAQVLAAGPASRSAGGCPAGAGRCDGSSSTYSTPTRPEPIWVASRMRCASPPDRVPAAAVQRQVVQADVDQEPQPGVDLLEHPLGDHLLPVGRARCAPSSSAHSPTDRAQTSAMLLAGDGDREDLGLEPGAAAGRAGHVAHVALVPVAGPVATRCRRAGARSTAPRPRSRCSRSARGRTCCGSARAPGPRRRTGSPSAPAAGSCPPRGVEVEALLRRRAPRAAAGSTPACARSTTAGSRPRAASAPGRARSAPGRPPSWCRGRCTPGRRRRAR